MMVTDSGGELDPSASSGGSSREGESQVEGGGDILYSLVEKVSSYL